MPNCSKCGKHITQTEVYRRQIYVGTTQRVNYGKRVSVGASNHYRLQNVCYECAQAIDEANAKSEKLLLTIIIIIAIIAILFFYFIT
jgi:uncharacterized protein (DUF983 family)